VYDTYRISNILKAKYWLKCHFGTKPSSGEFVDIKIPREERSAQRRLTDNRGRSEADFSFGQREENLKSWCCLLLLVAARYFSNGRADKVLLLPT